jgi:hypothetical protein
MEKTDMYKERTGTFPTVNNRNFQLLNKPVDFQCSDNIITMEVGRGTNLLMICAVILDATIFRFIMSCKKEILYSGVK